jgi:hypothetical protein
MRQIACPNGNTHGGKKNAPVVMVAKTSSGEEILMWFN